MKRIREQIKSNKIKCKKCRDIIESYDVHDFKWCSCGAVAVDGGCDYLKRTGSPKDYEELSYIMKLVEVNIDGFEKEYNALAKKDMEFSKIKCHVCNSNNITILKGNGELIEGDDAIALICHDCEKIYYFSDVVYKKNYKSSLMRPQFWRHQIKNQ